MDTIMRGGDTDTNAAICGALLGAVYGRKAVPIQWVESLLKCRPASRTAECAQSQTRVFLAGGCFEVG